MSIGLRIAKTMDFTCSSPSTNMMKGLYLGTIASRAGLARDKSEVRETLVRDIPGFMTFFYVAGIIQNVVGFALDKISKYGENASTLVKGPGEGKNFLQMLNPFTKYKVRSFADIENLQGLISEKNLNLLKRNKSIANVIGLATSISVLGIFLTNLNVKMTRARALKEQQAAKQQSTFSPKANFTLDTNLKPQTCKVNVQA